MNSIEGNVDSHKLYRCLIAILFCVFASVPLQAQAATKEQAVKAGFIYNLTRFTVWPSDVKAVKKFNLCIIGNDALGGSLKALRGKLVGNKPVVLRRGVKDSSLHSCHIAFIAKNSSDNVLQKLQGLPVLTVSDMPNFTDHGGMIGLIRNGSYVGLEVNLAAIRAVKLNVSAQLLKLAKKVKGLK